MVTDIHRSRGMALLESAINGLETIIEEGNHIGEVSNRIYTMIKELEALRDELLEQNTN